MAPTVLLSRLLVLVWNHEVIDYIFLRIFKSVIRRRGLTYDSCLLLVGIVLVLLDTLLAAEEDISVA